MYLINRRVKRERFNKDGVSLFKDHWREEISGKVAKFTHSFVNHITSFPLCVKARRSFRRKRRRAKNKRLGHLESKLGVSIAKGPFP